MTANNTNKGNTAVMNPSVPPTPDSPGRKTNIPGKSSPRQKQQVEGVPLNLKTPADQEKQQQQREPERVATETSTASSSTSATGDGKGAVIGEYVLGETIGKGTFGKVKLGLHTLTGEKVAVKILEKKRIVQAADVERVAREIKILKRNRHPNVIQLYEVIDSPDRIFLIMEHIDGGEMFEYIVAHHRIREPEAAFLFRQIVEGLAYLHSNEVTHRDLKPENLLLQSNNHNSRQQQQQATDSTLLVKIVDFGLSNTHDGGRLLRTACGSPCYAAPEMIQGRLYRGPIADMWSLGVVLFAMVCGFLPFEDSNTNMLYKKILSANYKMPTFLSASVQDLIRRILETDPDKRYTVDKILQHPWLAGVQKPDISAEEVQSALSKKSFNRFTASYYLLDSKLQRLVRDRIIPAPTFGNALINRSTPSSDNKRQDRLQVRTGGSDARITSSGSAGGSSKTIEVTGTTHRVPESPRRRSNPHHPPQQQHSETQKASAQRSAAPTNAAPPRHTGGSGSTQRPGSVRSGRNLVMISNSPIISSGTTFLPIAPNAPRDHRLSGTLTTRKAQSNSRVTVSNGMVALRPLVQPVHPPRRELPPSTATRRHSTEVAAPPYRNVHDPTPAHTAHPPSYQSISSTNGAVIIRRRPQGPVPPPHHSGHTQSPHQSHVAATPAVVPPHSTFATKSDDTRSPQRLSMSTNS
ncbi:SNF1-related protein kinase catalytic subunit alpha KIN10 [Phytophthora nicotianae]|uniref:SNF1-related protein kinase catalytic subunit alpha KIN10 n=1 Tax=Phytophthora nicotianae TaxID=4792 RepID=A0A0W8C3N9_PHYNI|nr:SNF1-related protein kinase catalytic subunit alpha KIN10 [Phytophthora nicotianae]